MYQSELWSKIHCAKSCANLLNRNIIFALYILQDSYILCWKRQNKFKEKNISSLLLKVVNNNTDLSFYET